MKDHKSMQAEQALAYYSSLIGSQELLQKEMQDAIDQAMPQEVLDRIDDIKAELQPEIERLDTEISLVAEWLKEYVIQIGETLKGEYHMVVAAKGRTTWNTKGLQGYAIAHPEIEVFKSVHDPSASIRRVS